MCCHSNNSLLLKSRPQSWKCSWCHSQSESQGARSLCSTLPQWLCLTSSARQSIFADSISSIQIISSTGRLTHENTSLLKFIRLIQMFLKSGEASISSCAASHFLEMESLTNRSGSSTRTFELCVVCQGSPGHAKHVELPPFRSKVCHHYPLFHSLRDVPHRKRTAWA